MTEKASIKLTDTISVEVVDPDDIRLVYADLVTELRVVNGCLHLSLATMVIDGDSSGTARSARVCARLRIAPNTVHYIRQAIVASNKDQIPVGQTIN